MVGRTINSSAYRFSINGQEKSDEIAPNTTTALYWEYDSRIVKRWNVDPIYKEWESPYLCFSGNPIFYADKEGLEPEAPKGKTITLPEVVVKARKPKEGSRRLNPAFVKQQKEIFKQNISSFLSPSYSVVKPPDKIEDVGTMFQYYHKGGNAFNAGWYDSDVYGLTTLDWDGGQVMNERDGWDDAARQFGFDDYTPVRGVLGGRNWNGYQVDDKGYLTGNTFAGASLIEMNLFGGLRGGTKTLRYLNRLGKLMQNEKSRQYILNSIQNSKLKNVLNDIYRYGAQVGNTSSMAAFRLEQLTGRLVGGKSHAIKLLNSRRALVGVLKQSLNQADKRMARELLKDITNALRGN